jgi:Rod binding domain-containing protein
MKIPPPAPRQIDGPRNRDDVDPTIRKAAEGLESIFMNQMMDAMRGTVGESEFSMENSATKIYRGMLDTEVSQRAAKTNSIGLADQIIAYLEQRGYNGNKASAHGRPKPLAPLPAAPPPAIDKEVGREERVKNTGGTTAGERTGGTDAS